MKKKGVVFAILIIFLIVVVVLIFKFKADIKKDQQLAKENMAKIETEYKIFSQNIDLFNDKREELAEVFSQGNVYYENLAANSSLIVKKLEECDDAVSKTLTESSSLKELCKKYYRDEEINQMCTNYQASFPKVYQILKQDVDDYNKMVQKYNLWVKDNPKFKTIKEYTLKVEEPNE